MFNKYTNDTVIDLYPGRKWEYLKSQDNLI